ncbi:TldD/PmbA family protein [Aureimonas sp. SK2]|uniref:TldD/PmbA family protein n=1 Tax=Aureimonas sp. SK2 TaxID=3015992 RepID=UPI002443F7E7|nr:metallopeptidase TldD-related protein [Aureimonas sp. SK2]
MASSLIDHFDLSRAEVEAIVSDTLQGADDGELFLEYREQESLLFDNGRLKAGDFSTEQGFGLRCVAGETIGFAHSGDLSGAALKRAASSVGAVRSGHSGVASEGPKGTNRHLYGAENPIPEPSFAEKVKLLEEINAYLRDADEAVRQVSASLASQWQVVEILRADGRLVRDVRPLVRLNVSVVAGRGDRQETGSGGAGGRHGFTRLVEGGGWRSIADEALRQARLNLEAVPAPAGTFDTVLASGWPGVMLHEAVGHGLEGDYNRKKTSAFSGLLGQQVAARGVTVVDDGTIAERRGSLSVDDEGTPTNRTVLIEDGKLVNYMQDRQNARLMGMEVTGNGRRQSFAHAPMPRMTNTMMLNGPHSPEEILASVKDGVYAVSFNGGQVDITSGKFVFNCTEAYRIRDGKVSEPLRGVMLIGNGPDAMHRVSMVGNDVELDLGIGNCGKAGQWVPVGVGQPHLRMDQMTVGGTEA